MEIKDIMRVVVLVRAILGPENSEFSAGLNKST